MPSTSNTSRAPATRSPIRPTVGGHTTTPLDEASALRRLLHDACTTAARIAWLCGDKETRTVLLDRLATIRKEGGI